MTAADTCTVTRTYRLADRVLITPTDYQNDVAGGGYDGPWRGCVINHNTDAGKIIVRVTNGPAAAITKIIDFTPDQLHPFDMSLGFATCDLPKER